MWQVLALLYKGQGRPDLSLAIYLQLQLPSVFDFIQVGRGGGTKCDAVSDLSEYCVESTSQRERERERDYAVCIHTGVS